MLAWIALCWCFWQRQSGCDHLSQACCWWDCLGPYFNLLLSWAIQPFSLVLWSRVRCDNSLFFCLSRSKGAVFSRLSTLARRVLAACRSPVLRGRLLHFQSWRPSWLWYLRFERLRGEAQDWRRRIRDWARHLDTSRRLRRKDKRTDRLWRSSERINLCCSYMFSGPCCEKTKKGAI